jgi:hypothetical protein
MEGIMSDHSTSALPARQALCETDKAWMAGFIDGEGCLTISRQVRPARPSPAYRVFLTVSNTNRAPLEFFQSVYGGGIYHVHERRKDKGGKNWADAFDWYCPVYSLRVLIADVGPYLRVKHKQAELILEFLLTKKAFARGERQAGKRGGSAALLPAEIEHREGLRLKIQALNSKGRYARSRLA